MDSFSSKRSTLPGCTKGEPSLKMLSQVTGLPSAISACWRQSSLDMLYPTKMVSAYLSNVCVSLSSLMACASHLACRVQSQKLEW